MARTPDLERRQELLDRIVDHLAEQGLAQTTLRPLAAALGVSIDRAALARLHERFCTEGTMAAADGDSGYRQQFRQQ